MKSKFEFASEAERRRYEEHMRRKSRITLKGAEEMHPTWGVSTTMELFTEEQLNAIRAQYGQFDTMDPTGSAYVGIVTLLDQLPQHILVQLSGANIRFVSALARNRVKK